ncbi:hypothetical protein AmaxDRAFT_5641 [Limnospira maxima CS-328]|uniref:Uncharacterized protein n=1 Tax=Limnospira maxima CS-328 TaxID=513049 RepID=B5WA41_LIMMA|nr:hypothetical protein AmaxDRAFT_5641 [Limnospira maxima CS-328]
MFPSPDGELVGLDFFLNFFEEGKEMFTLFPSPDGELVGLDPYKEDGFQEYRRALCFRPLTGNW